ncbi:sigma-70 family RNA polymerase sigma factor [Pseudophaeobacter sp.]|uniref:sigma-70 family RNA polymerase sigma factor n=1 Tax=Pseudophaeobacter sp. TaxID=1971739 RepID=UPI003299F2EB
MLDHIWQQYRAEISRFLLRRIANPDDVDDLLQEVLLKVHRALPDLPADTPLLPWIFRITRNATTDHYRRKARDSHLAQLAPDDLWYGENEPEPLDLAQCITPFLSALPKQDAGLLQAIDLEGTSQRDHAEALGLPYSTVKTRVQAARLKLRHQFDNCCAFHQDSQGRVFDYSAKSEGCKKC